MQVIESLNVAHGGTAAACSGLASQLAEKGVAVTIATVESGNEARRAALDPRVETVGYAPSWPPRLRFSRAFGRALERLAPPSLIHVHGLWRLHLWQAAAFAERRQIPLIVSTHGMLKEAALGQRAWRKAAFRMLGQDRLLDGVACIHATAKEEAAEIRRLGFAAPIAVIPWGVDARLTGVPAVSGAPIVVFLGRFHPTTGLDVLLRAWARIAKSFPSAHLKLAGYDDGGFREQFHSAARSLGIASSTSFLDPVEGGARERLFAESSVLVLPSAAESFGLVVPESLVRGVPAIATHGAPWSSLVEERCGWWVPATEEALAGALAEAVGSSPSALREMGERGRQFACATFDWARVTTSMLALYGWTLGRAPQPSFVER